MLNRNPDSYMLNLYEPGKFKSIVIRYNSPLVISGATTPQ
jgi:hypothetical protein